jgi:hypothetical protein
MRGYWSGTSRMNSRFSQFSATGLRDQVSYSLGWFDYREFPVGKVYFQITIELLPSRPPDLRLANWRSDSVFHFIGTLSISARISV